AVTPEKGITVGGNKFQVRQYLEFDIKVGVQVKLGALRIIPLQVVEVIALVSPVPGTGKISRVNEAPVSVIGGIPGQVEVHLVEGMLPVFAGIVVYGKFRLQCKPVVDFIIVVQAKTQPVEFVI